MDQEKSMPKNKDLRNIPLHPRLADTLSPNSVMHMAQYVWTSWESLLIVIRWQQIHILEKDLDYSERLQPDLQSYDYLLT